MAIFSLVSLYLLANFVITMFALATNKRLKLDRFNACGLVGLVGNTEDCGAGAGGIVRAFVADLKDLDLDGATFDSATGHLTDLPWVTEDTPYVEFVPDDNDQASYNQEGARDDNGVFTATGTGNLTFSSVSASKYDAANKLIECCSLVVLYEWQNGLITLQGVITRKIDAAWVLKRTKKAARAIPSINSNTTADGETDQIVVTIVSTANRFSTLVHSSTSVEDLVEAEDLGGGGGGG